MTRRRFLAAVATGATAALAGCQALRSDREGPTFSVESAVAYRLRGDRYGAVVSLARDRRTTGRVKLRWDVDVGEYVQVGIEEHVIPAKDSDPEVAVLVAGSRLNDDAVSRSQLKIVRDGAPDGDWFPVALGR